MEAKQYLKDAGLTSDQVDDALAIYSMKYRADLVYWSAQAGPNWREATQRQKRMKDQYAHIIDGIYQKHDETFKTIVEQNMKAFDIGGIGVPGGQFCGEARDFDLSNFTG